jgi:hypothetical protein
VYTQETLGRRKGLRALVFVVRATMGYRYFCVSLMRYPVLKELPFVCEIHVLRLTALMSSRAVAAETVRVLMSVVDCPKLHDHLVVVPGPSTRGLLHYSCHGNSTKLAATEDKTSLPDQ